MYAYFLIDISLNIFRSIAQAAALVYMYVQ